MGNFKKSSNMDFFIALRAMPLATATYLLQPIFEVERGP
jgi:hypothetical protein